MRIRLTPSMLFVGALFLPSTGCGQGNAAFIKAAEAGASREISGKAAIARIDPKAKKVTQIRAGTNGFTCSLLPDGSDAPVCGDQNAWQWVVDAFLGQPKPTNSAPGIAYMAQGGVHYETPDGQIVMEAGANTKEVKEPPHWMVLWPFDPAASGLPAKATAGTYIMFAGTPYAHLMIYQDPGMLK